MTPHEVQTLPGLPVDRFDQHVGELNPPEVRYDHVWKYVSWEWLSAGGVDLSARFREGRLVNVTSY